MKRASNLIGTIALIALVLGLTAPRVARCADAGEPEDAVVREASDSGCSDACSDQDAAPPVGIQPTKTPDNYGCAVAGGAGSSFAAGPVLSLVGLAGALSWLRRDRANRRRRGRDRPPGASGAR